MSKKYIENDLFACFCLLVILRIEFRASQDSLAKKVLLPLNHSSIILLFLFVFQIGFHAFAQASLSAVSFTSSVVGMIGVVVTPGSKMVI
jgi:hypothetical protein